jgi:hypothetical protein
LGAPRTRPRQTTTVATMVSIVMSGGSEVLAAVVDAVLKEWSVVCSWAE